MLVKIIVVVASFGTDMNSYPKAPLFFKKVSFVSTHGLKWKLKKAVFGMTLQKLFTMFKPIKSWVNTTEDLVGFTNSLSNKF